MRQELGICACCINGCFIPMIISQGDPNKLILDYFYPDKLNYVSYKVSQHLNGLNSFFAVFFAPIETN